MSSTTNLPRISVVTPSYNQGQFIEKTIDSVLSQNYPNLEYIIIDGGSTDQSVEIIKKYERYLAYWISEEDQGQSHAINKGLAHATGAVFAWLNSDDWYTREALSCFAETAQKHPECGVWVGNGDMLNADGSIYYQPKYDDDITLKSLFKWLSGHDFMQPSAAFSRTAWEVCGPLDEEEHIALDVDFWIRIAKAGFRFTRIQKLLSHSQVHASAKTTAMRENMYVEAALVIARHGGYIEARHALLEQVGRIQDCKTKLEWYQKNYLIATNYPLVRMIRPIAKFMTADMSNIWPKEIPPWLK